MGKSWMDMERPVEGVGRFVSWMSMWSIPDQVADVNGSTRDAKAILFGSICIVVHDEKPLSLQEVPIKLTYLQNGTKASYSTTAVCTTQMKCELYEMII